MQAVPCLLHPGRGAFIGRSHFGVPTDLTILAALAALFLALGARAFSRIQV